MPTQIDLSDNAIRQIPTAVVPRTAGTPLAVIDAPAAVESPASSGTASDERSFPTPPQSPFKRTAATNHPQSPARLSTVPRPRSLVGAARSSSEATSQTFSESQIQQRRISQPTHMLHSAASPTLSSVSDSTPQQALRDQLERAKEQLSKHNIIRQRLKAELEGVRSDLVHAQAEIHDLKEQLAIAKRSSQNADFLCEQLQTTQADLATTGDALRHVLGWIVRHSMSQFVASEIELHSLDRYLNHVYSTTIGCQYESDLLLPPRKVWDPDSDYDSDSEMDFVFATAKSHRSISSHQPWWRSHSHDPETDSHKDEMHRKYFCTTPDSCNSESASHDDDAHRVSINTALSTPVRKPLAHFSVDASLQPSSQSAPVMHAIDPLSLGVDSIGEQLLSQWEKSLAPPADLDPPQTPLRSPHFEISYELTQSPSVSSVAQSPTDVSPRSQSQAGSLSPVFETTTVPVDRSSRTSGVAAAARAYVAEAANNLQSIQVKRASINMASIASPLSATSNSRSSSWLGPLQSLMMFGGNRPSGSRTKMSVTPSPVTSPNTTSTYPSIDYDVDDAIGIERPEAVLQQRNTLSKRSSMLVKVSDHEVYRFDDPADEMDAADVDGGADDASRCSRVSEHAFNSHNDLRSESGQSSASSRAYVQSPQYCEALTSYLDAGDSADIEYHQPAHANVVSEMHSSAVVVDGNMNSPDASDRYKMRSSIVRISTMPAEPYTSGSAKPPQSAMRKQRPASIAVQIPPRPSEPHAQPLQSADASTSAMHIVTNTLGSAFETSWGLVPSWLKSKQSANDP